VDSFLTDELILMKLDTIAVYKLRRCIRKENPTVFSTKGMF